MTVADLYRRHYRIEDVFFDRQTGIESIVSVSRIRKWGIAADEEYLTIFYVVSRSGQVTEELVIEFDRILLKMLIRGFYYFSVVYQNNYADDPVKYFATPEN